MGYVQRRRDAGVHASGEVDERERHFDALREECRTGRHDGVGRTAQVARVFDVTPQTEKHAFSWNALLVRQTARVVAADVGTVADVALALVPNGFASEAENTTTADEHAVVVEADERPHQRGVTLSR